MKTRHKTANKIVDHAIGIVKAPFGGHADYNHGHCPRDECNGAQEFAPSKLGVEQQSKQRAEDDQKEYGTNSKDESKFNGGQKLGILENAEVVIQSNPFGNGTAKQHDLVKAVLNGCKYGIEGGKTANEQNRQNKQPCNRQFFSLHTDGFHISLPLVTIQNGNRPVLPGTGEERKAALPLWMF